MSKVKNPAETSLVELTSALESLNIVETQNTLRQQLQQCLFLRKSCSTLKVGSKKKGAYMDLISTILPINIRPYKSRRVTLPILKAKVDYLTDLYTFGSLHLILAIELLLGTLSNDEGSEQDKLLNIDTMVRTVGALVDALNQGCRCVEFWKHKDMKTSTKAFDKLHAYYTNHAVCIFFYNVFLCTFTYMYICSLR